MSIKEFDHLVFKAMAHFCKMRNPSKVLSRPEMGCIIDQAVSELHRYMGAVNAKKITRREFEYFGKYLTSEYRRLTDELEFNVPGWV